MQLDQIICMQIKAQVRLGSITQSVLNILCTWLETVKNHK